MLIYIVNKHTECYDKKVKKRNILIIFSLAVILFSAWLLNQTIYLRKAHSTFENYYAFRGCTQLLTRTADYGICKTVSGQTIKIVKFNNEWYLDGDLPTCWNNICF